MAVVQNGTILATDMAALAGLANAKTTLTGTPYNFPDVDIVTGNPQWLTELNRLTDAVVTNLFPQISNNPHLSLQSCMPWPINNPATNSISNIYVENFDFYHADTGNVESIVIAAEIFNVPVVNEVSGFNEFKFTVTVGGTTAYDFIDGLKLNFILTQSSGAVIVDEIFSSNWPSSFHLLATTDSNPGQLSVIFNPGLVPPGVYTFVASFPSFTGPTITATFGATQISLTFNSRVATPAIHGMATVFKITGGRTAGGLPEGIYQNGVQMIQTFALQATTLGYFVGATTYNNRTVPSIGSGRGDLMPWSPVPGSSDTSPFYQANRNWSPGWTPPFGWKFIDSNGNYQFIATAGGGITGNTQPFWRSLPGDLTVDGSSTWEYVGPAPLNGRFVSCPRWPYFKSTNPTSVLPAANSSFVNSPAGWFIGSVALNQNVTNTLWQPHTVYTAGQYILDTNYNLQQCTTAGISGGTAPAWSKVIGNTTADGGPPPFGTPPGAVWTRTELTVTLGVIRNTVFVPFGTYQTGTIQQNVFWPVFTATPICYVCAAGNVDVQAMTINMDTTIIVIDRENNFIPPHTRFCYPVRADAYNWLLAMLGLIT